MRVRTAVLVAAFASAGLFAVSSGTAEAQARGRSRPSGQRQGAVRAQAGPATGQRGPGPGAYRPGPGQNRPPGRPVYGRPAPGRTQVRIGVGFGYGYGYGYYRPAYFYSPWGWYPWYPWDFYGWSYPYGPYGAYGPYGYYGYYGYNGSSLKVEVQPKDAEVYVDGRRAGIVDQFDGFFQRLTVEAGGHDITLFKPGFRTVTQNIYLQPGSTFKLKYTMEALGPGETAEPPPQPAPEPQPQVQQPGPRPRRPMPPTMPPGEEMPPPPEPGRAPRIEAQSGYGQLAVRVQPEGAQVFIDGEAWQGPGGMERLVVHLPVGKHRLEVRKDGYEPFMAQFEITLGETTTLNVSLVGVG